MDNNTKEFTLEGKVITIINFSDELDNIIASTSQEIKDNTQVLIGTNYSEIFNVLPGTILIGHYPTIPSDSKHFFYISVTPDIRADVYMEGNTISGDFIFNLIKGYNLIEQCSLSNGNIKEKSRSFLVDGITSASLVCPASNDMYCKEIITKLSNVLMICVSFSNDSDMVETFTREIILSSYHKVNRQNYSYPSRQNVTTNRPEQFGTYNAAAYPVQQIINQNITRGGVVNSRFKGRSTGGNLVRAITSNTRRNMINQNVPRDRMVSSCNTSNTGRNMIISNNSHNKLCNCDSKDSNTISTCIHLCVCVNCVPKDKTFCSECGVLLPYLS